MTTIASADDLRARVRALAVDEPSPAVITDQVLRALTDPEFRVVATVTLHEFVRTVLSRGALPPAQTYETATGARVPSAKIAAVRDWVARELRRSVCVDEGDSTWRFLAECTADEVYAAAAIRRRKAAETAAEAERFEGIGKAVEHAGVDRVGELPRDILEAVLRR